MSFQKRAIRAVVISLGVFSIALSACRWAGAEQDKQKPERMQAVMLKKLSHVQSILAGFLFGNDDLVIINSEAIADKAGDIADAVRLDKEPDAEEWQMLGELTKAAHQTAQSMKAGKSDEALEQFKAVIQRCVACHHVRRR